MGIHTDKGKRHFSLLGLKDHLQAQFGFGAKHLSVFGNASFFTSLRIFHPRFGKKQPTIDQRGLLRDAVSQKHPHLTAVDFAQRPTVLTGNADGFVPLFGNPTLVQNQGIGSPRLTRRHHTDTLCTDRLDQGSILPGRGRDKVRQGLLVHIGNSN